MLSVVHVCVSGRCYCRTGGEIWWQVVRQVPPVHPHYSLRSGPCWGSTTIQSFLCVNRNKKMSDILQVLIYILGYSCRFINPLLRCNLHVMWIFVIYSTQDMDMDSSLRSVGALRVAGHPQEGPEALHQVPMRGRDSCKLFSWLNIQHAQIKV